MDVSKHSNSEVYISFTSEIIAPQISTFSPLFHFPYSTLRIFPQLNPTSRCFEDSISFSSLSISSYSSSSLFRIFHSHQIPRTHHDPLYQPTLPSALEPSSRSHTPNLRAAEVSFGLPISLASTLSSQTNQPGPRMILKLSRPRMRVRLVEEVRWRGWGI
jgi:hypothetical protein